MSKWQKKKNNDRSHTDRRQPPHTCFSRCRTNVCFGLRRFPNQLVGRLSQNTFCLCLSPSFASVRSHQTPLVEYIVWGGVLVLEVVGIFFCLVLGSVGLVVAVWRITFGGMFRKPQLYVLYSTQYSRKMVLPTTVPSYRYSS